MWSLCSLLAAAYFCITAQQHLRFLITCYLDLWFTSLTVTPSSSCAAAAAADLLLQFVEA
jgi:hypothetical protein